MRATDAMGIQQGSCRSCAHGSRIVPFLYFDAEAFAENDFDMM